MYLNVLQPSDVDPKKNIKVKRSILYLMLCLKSINLSNDNFMVI